MADMICHKVYELLMSILTLYKKAVQVQQESLGCLIIVSSHPMQSMYIFQSILILASVSNY